MSETGSPIPLKITAVDPPSLNTANGEGYSVRLRLSRKATKYEISAMPEVSKNSMRIYGDTLEIYNTTIEKIAASTSDLATMVSTAEAAGLKAQQRADTARAQLEAAELARTNEEARLAQLAGEIKFD